MSKTYKVTLKPSGEIVEVEEGKNLLVALREQNIYIKSSCGGHATCSDCILKVVSGEDYITPPPFAELKLLGNVFHITKERLACQTCLTGDVTIDISKHDRATDEAKLKNKTVNFSKKKQHIKIRKEPDIKKIRTERADERAKEEVENLAKAETWKKHWEKNQDSEAPKKLAGGKRPKFFDTDKVDYEKNDYTRPLSPEKQKMKDDRLETERLKAANDKKNIATDKEYKKFRE
ncbi:MAG: 2Fe-2S iron-sulfur cluster binding domain-containing protein [Bacteriovorax sp.]|nr:2Fe-2S iron-sulfur cluster binding domain-containing protein [Bacteriovorax sp.]